MKNVLVLLLAGNGKRLYEHIKVKKQFYKVNTKELFLYSLDTFIESGKIQTYVLVISEEDQDEAIKILHRYPKYEECNIILVYGGKTRSESVRNALYFLHESKNAEPDDKIIIHDADRPLLKQSDISFYLSEASSVDAVTPVVKIHDSLLENTNHGFVYRSRDFKYLVQTPQIFTFGPIYDIYRHSFVSNETDDFRRALEKGLNNKVITGNPLTFKVTNYQDLLFLLDIVSNK